MSNTALTVEQLDALLARVDEAARVQATPPRVVAPDDPLAAYWYFMTQNVEATIDDSARKRRPDFVMDDDKGWAEVPWTY